MIFLHHTKASVKGHLTITTCVSNIFWYGEKKLEERKETTDFLMEDFLFQKYKFDKLYEKSIIVPLSFDLLHGCIILSLSSTNLKRKEYC